MSLSLTHIYLERINVSEGVGEDGGVWKGLTRFGDGAVEGKRRGS